MRIPAALLSVLLATSACTFGAVGGPNAGEASDPDAAPELGDLDAAPDVIEEIVS